MEKGPDEGADNFDEADDGMGEGSAEDRDWYPAPKIVLSYGE